MKTRRKQYLESSKTLAYMEKNIPKQKESAWIREATEAKMLSEQKKK